MKRTKNLFESLALILLVGLLVVVSFFRIAAIRTAEAKEQAAAYELEKATAEKLAEEEAAAEATETTPTPAAPVQTEAPVEIPAEPKVELFNAAATPETIEAIPEESAQYHSLYREILNAFYDYCQSADKAADGDRFTSSLRDALGFTGEEEPYKFSCALSELLMGLEYDPANIGKLGYMFKDLNGDQVSELIIGSTQTGEAPYDGYSGMEEVLMVFSCRNGKPLFTTGGWSRSRIWLLDNGELYSIGSGGAASNYMEVCRVSETDGSLITEDLWNLDTTTVYHVKNYKEDDTIQDPKNRIDMTPEQFSAMGNDFAARTVHLDLIPFAQLQRIG